MTLNPLIFDKKFEAKLNEYHYENLNHYEALYSKILKFKNNDKDLESLFRKACLSSCYFIRNNWYDPKSDEIDWTIKNKYMNDEQFTEEERNIFNSPLELFDVPLIDLYYNEVMKTDFYDYDNPRNSVHKFGDLIVKANYFNVNSVMALNFWFFKEFFSDFEFNKKYSNVRKKIWRFTKKISENLNLVLKVDYTTSILNLRNKYVECPFINIELFHDHFNKEVADSFLLFMSQNDMAVIISDTNNVLSELKIRFLINNITEETKLKQLYYNNMYTICSMQKADLVHLEKLLRIYLDEHPS